MVFVTVVATMRVGGRKPLTKLSEDGKVVARFIIS
jgi:hypothetical protein